MQEIKLLSFKKNDLMNDENQIPYGVKLIKAPNLWEEGYQGEGIIISILDTGCDYNHTNLKNNIIGGYNFTNEYNNDPKIFLDNNGHGTHIAGIIAANRGENKGIMGVAPKSKLLILKTLLSTGTGDWKSLISAIDYSINWRGQKGEKVRIISMSLGLDRDIPDLHNVIKKAVLHNIIVVCSAGNDGDGNKETVESQYPAIYPEVIQVGAIDEHKHIATFSNTNNAVDIVAPGVRITSTFLNGTYATFSGTSMATPHITGAIALLINKYEKKYSKTLSYSETLKLLYQHTKEIRRNKNEEGNGLVVLTEHCS